MMTLDKYKQALIDLTMQYEDTNSIVVGLTIIIHNNENKERYHFDGEKLVKETN